MTPLSAGEPNNPVDRVFVGWVMLPNGGTVGTSLVRFARTSDGGQVALQSLVPGTLHPLAFHCGQKGIAIGHRARWIEPELILSYLDVD